MPANPYEPRQLKSLRECCYNRGMSLDPVNLLQRLIATPSVNPMGRPLSQPTQGETRMTDLLQSVCEQQGWPWLRQQVHEERENLVALVPGQPPPADGGELLLWDVHQDTVPVDGMTVAPFGGELRDGRVYGRGACDVKGAMAAMVGALSRVSAGKDRQGEPSLATASPERPGPSLQRRGNGLRRPTVVLACTVNEECGFTGATALCDLWNPERSGAAAISTGNCSAQQIFPRPPDAAIVAEPTQFKVVVAHHGVVRWRCHTSGRAAHTSRPDEGVNAIYAMARVVAAIERFHVLLQQAAAHPLCGRPSVCVSTIHGGVGVNTVPERATIEIDRRLGPNDRPEPAYNELIEYIRQQVDVGRCLVEHDPPFMRSFGLSDGANRAVAERVATIARACGRASELIGVPFGTDAAALSAAGVPTVVVGPGSIAQAHTANEFIEMEELKLGEEMFYRIACEGVGAGI